MLTVLTLSVELQLVKTLLLSFLFGQCIAWIQLGLLNLGYYGVKLIS